MQIFLYDQSLEGLLTTIFEAYRQKRFPEQLLAHNTILPLFTDHAVTIQTDTEKATRVWQTLQKKLSAHTLHKILYTWLSELPDSDTLLFKVIRKLVDSKDTIESNLADDDILLLHQTAQKVNKERLHLMQFVRFQKTTDDIYFAPVNPVYNALPLAINHFQDRFADQQWIIYDIIRRYGYFYNLKTTTEITLDWDEHFDQGQLKQSALGTDEQLIQTLWKKYFKTLTIQERLNPKLQRQHMPKRFWAYLTETQPIV